MSLEEQETMAALPNAEEVQAAKAAANKPKQRMRPLKQKSSRPPKRPQTSQSIGCVCLDRRGAGGESGCNQAKTADASAQAEEVSAAKAAASKPKQ